MRDVRFLCAGALPNKRNAAEISLNIGIRGDGRNAYIMTLHQVTRQMMVNLPDRLWDLFSIASYVHLADRKVRRDGPEMANLGENWRRHFVIVIALRDPEFWNDPDINESLRRAIGFLSGDHYQFEFVPLPNAPRWQPFLDFVGSDPAPGFRPDEVILFSRVAWTLCPARCMRCWSASRLQLSSHISRPPLFRLFRAN